MLRGEESGSGFIDGAASFNSFYLNQQQSQNEDSNVQTPQPPTQQQDGFLFKALEERALAEDFLHIDHEVRV